MSLAIVSDLPGRVRWFVPELRDHAELAARMERALTELATVRSVRANPVTGRLLVHFDEQVTTRLMQAAVLEKLRVQVMAAGTGAAALGLTPGFKATTLGFGAAGAAGMGLSLGLGPTVGVAVAVAAGVTWYVAGRLWRPSRDLRAGTVGPRPLLLRELAPTRQQVVRAAGLSGAGALALIVHCFSAGFALDVVINGSTRVFGIGLAGASGAVVLVSISILAAVVRAWARHRSQTTFGHATHSIQETLRDRLVEHMLGLEVADIDEHRRRELQAVLTSDVNELGSAFNAMWALGDMAVTSAVLLGGIFSLSTTAGLIALAPVPALVGLSFQFAPRIQAAHASLRYQVVEIGGEVADSLEGLETIKGFTAEAGQSERLRRASAAYRRTSSEAMRALGKFPLVLETSVLGVLIAVTSVNGRLVRESKLSFGRFNALSMLTSHLVFPLLMVGPHYDRAAAGQSSYAEIRAELDAPVPSDEQLPELRRTGTRGEVVFRDVDFAYPGARTLFSRLSLRFPSRKTTAVVGFSGSGKSTLIKLLLRFRDPDSGTIEIDGNDITGLRRRSVRQAVSVVSQDMRLLHRSIEDNIRLGRSEGDRAAVDHFARLAQAQEFIVKLPDGYATVLGRDGTMLSGGERQRIGIARALMKPAPILVFDEATSNLDSRTEVAIHQMLEDFRRRCTVILIAHRLSTVRDADHIYFLDGGELAEQGTHDELLARGGKYRMLWEMQGGDAS